MILSDSVLHEMIRQFGKKWLKDDSRASILKILLFVWAEKLRIKYEHNANLNT